MLKSNWNLSFNGDKLNVGSFESKVMDIAELLAFTVKNKASDLHLSAGLPPMIRVDGDVRRINLPPLEHKELHDMIYDIMNDYQRKEYEENYEIDFSFEIPGLARFRVNSFNQNRGCGAVFRTIPTEILTFEDLNCPAIFKEIIDIPRGLILVTGPTGSGKTTLINMLGGFIPSNERIITCEDSAELDFPQDHVVRLETKPPSLEGDGAVDIRCLVKQTLRMRPDRIVVGECRGGETLDMLQAMNTGHDGSMTTVHSNTPRDCMSRLETLVQYSGVPISPKAIREMIASAVHMVIQQTRLEDGSRRVMNITEIGGMQGEVITLQDIFAFKQEGMNKQGKIIGKYMATGFIPKFIEMLEKKGYKVPRGLFNNE